MKIQKIKNFKNNSQPDSRVLDVGAGSGFLSACFARYQKAQSEETTGIVVGIEHHPELVKFAIGEFLLNFKI